MFLKFLILTSMNSTLDICCRCAFVVEIQSRKKLYKSRRIFIYKMQIFQFMFIVTNFLKRIRFSNPQKQIDNVRFVFVFEQKLFYTDLFNSTDFGCYLIFLLKNVYMHLHQLHVRSWKKFTKY